VPFVPPDGPREPNPYVDAIIRRAADERQAKAADAALTPGQRAARDRENDLLQRALTNSPDYVQAVRRAAVANVDAEASPAGRQNPQTNAAAREQRIAAEEARLSDAVERRRREQLAQTAQRDQALRNQQAAYSCEARAAQMDAAYYNPRSLLNLEGLAASNQTRQACLEAYSRTGIVP
jgi:hypothetical protein